MLIIKDKLGADVVATYDYDYSGTFMEDRKVSAVVETPTTIAFEIGSTITYRGEVFTLQEDPTPRRVFSSLMITYNLTFYSAGYDLGLVAFYDVVKDDLTAYNRSSNLEVFVYGTVFQLMDRIVANMDRAGHAGWTHDINPALDLEVQDISLVNAYCSDAVGLIKSLFGLDYIIYGKDIRVGYPAVSASATVLSFGMNHGLCEISRIRSENKVITRAVGYGSNRNIPPDYRVDPTHLYNPRLMLPAPEYVSDAGLEAEFGIREGICPINEDIYPSIEGATYAGLPIDEIVSVLPYNEKDEIINEVVNEGYWERVNDPDFPLLSNVWHPPVFKENKVTASTTVSFYVNDPGFSIYDTDVITSSPAKISFTTGYMQGVEFKIVGFVKEEGQYKVTIERDASDTNHVIPNLVANISAGDNFVYLDMFLPSTYIAAAESKLVTHVTNWLNEQLYAPRAYAITVSEEYLAEEPVIEGNLFEGKTLTILDTQIGLGYPEEILIQSLSISHKASGQIFPTYNLTVSPTKITGTFGQMQNQLKEARLASAVNQTVINNSIQNVLKSVNILERHITTTERDINGVIIAPQSIYNTSLSIEVRRSNFILQAYLKVNYLGEVNDVYGSSGSLIHKDTDVVWGGIYDLAHQTWTIATPQTWTLEPYTTYWAYIKCNTADGTAIWVLSETKIGVLEIEGYYMFEWGQVMQLEAGTRVTQTTYGGSSNHAELTNLPWVDSGHSGTANKYAGFDVSGNAVYLDGGSSGDEKAKYDAADPTAGYLADKIIAGINITIEEGTGADENKLKISSTGGGGGGSYLDLTDTSDTTYVGKDKRVPFVNEANSELDLTETVQATLLKLDGPTVYTGAGGFAVKILPNETGFEFLPDGMDQIIPSASITIYNNYSKILAGKLVLTGSTNLKIEGTGKLTII